MAEILDCDAVVQQYNAQIRQRLTSTRNLVSVLTSSDRWSVTYQDHLARDTAELGFSYNPRQVTSDESLLRLIKECNKDNSVNGVLIFYPLGKEIRSNRYDLANAICPEKDVEGLNCFNIGRLTQGNGNVIAPAATEAVVAVLKHQRYDFKRKFGLIINRSEIVGQPLRIMLEHLGMTVTAVYEETDCEFIEDMMSKSDLIVTAVPDPKYKLPSKKVKEGSAVIAVNPSNTEEATLAERCSFITSKLGRVTRKVTLNNPIKLQEIFL